MTLNALAKEIHETAVSNGFGFDPQEISHITLKLLLIHSEVSEAAEALRAPDFDGVSEELADVVIRALDLMAGLDIDIDTVVLNKMARNKTRPHKHGKAF